MCCYVSSMFICECSCFSMVALVVYVASYSYSGTCSNNQFCCSCKYYDFETIQPCHGTTIASQEMSPSGEALCELMEKHAMPWWFLLFSNSAVKRLCFSKHRALPVWFLSLWLVGASLRWLFLGLAITVVDPLCYENADQLRIHIKIYIFLLISLGKWSYLVLDAHGIQITYCTALHSIRARNEP